MKLDLTFRDIIENLDDNLDCDFDKKANFYKSFDIGEQHELKDIIHLLNKDSSMERFLSEIDSINKDVLYQSQTHGYFHNERVLFFSFLISRFKNMDEISTKILFDAAKYHDIGRIDDDEDQIHGYNSAKKIDELLKNDPFYEEGENLKILKAAISLHSLDDSFMEKVIKFYGIEDEKRALEISEVLKDADGLDRVRLSMRYNFSSLDPSYLRNEESKKLIKISHQLNGLYDAYFMNYGEKRGLN